MVRALVKSTRDSYILDIISLSDENDMVMATKMAIYLFYF